MVIRKCITLNLLLLYLLLFLSAAAGQSSVGDVWLIPSAVTVPLYTTFYTEIRVNTGTDKVGAVGIDIGYNPEEVALDREQAAGGIDYSMSSLTTVINTRNSNYIKISGFRVDGVPAGAGVQLYTVFWKTLKVGTPVFTVTVNTLTSVSFMPIGTPAGIGSSVSITGIMLGDADGNGAVDIVDALKIAQYYVGEAVQGFIAPAADVNSDSTINIIDSLVIAQYYVGLIPRLPGQLPDPPVAPTPFPEPVPVTVKFHITGSGTAEIYIVSPDLFNNKLTVLTGADGGEQTIYYDTPLLLEVMPGSSFVQWGGDLTGSEFIKRFQLTGPLYIEAYFARGVTPAPTRTPSPTPSPSPVPTPTPVPTEIRDIGKVSFPQSEYTVPPGSRFTTPLQVNSGYQKLAAYGFDILYAAGLITPDTTAGDGGVVAGADGFVAAVNAETAGITTVSGFDVAGKGPGTKLEVLLLHWTAGEVQEPSEIGIVVKNLNDTAGAVIGDPVGVSSVVTIAPAQIPGDANNDGVINIVDALMSAQYIVGLNPAGFSGGSADVNGDGTVNIVDALMIAQYAVGLITHF